MEYIVVPTTNEIFNMSSICCQRERIRLKNEISFARGEETTGGRTDTDRISKLKVTLELIEDRLEILAHREAA